MEKTDLWYGNVLVISIPLSASKADPMKDGTMGPCLESTRFPVRERLLARQLVVLPREQLLRNGRGYSRSRRIVLERLHKSLRAMRCICGATLRSLRCLACALLRLGHRTRPRLVYHPDLGL